MASRSPRASVLALVSGLLLGGPAAHAQSGSHWVDPPSAPDVAQAPADRAPARSAQLPVGTSPASREQVARDLAYRYLDLWSAPNRVALASATSFYGPIVLFHGSRRTLGSVLAEKRHFAERWPERTYRYRPETTQIACEASGERCTVWSVFDFMAADVRHGRRSRGIGEHELVVSFASSEPVIVSERSRVLRRNPAVRALG